MGTSRFVKLRLLSLLTLLAIGLPALAGPNFQSFLQKFTGNESLPQGVKDLAYGEQVLHNKGLWREGAFSSDIDPAYVPESRPKFPLPYYLVPAESADFLEAESLSPAIRSQIVKTSEDGKEFYRLFVHPESYPHYAFLEGKFPWVGPEATEFMATPTSSYRSLIAWQPKNPNARPFVAKVSLDKNVIGSIDRLVSQGEVQRSIANQRAFDEIGEAKLSAMNVEIYPETAGLTLRGQFPGSPEKVGGQLIREIPLAVIEGRKRYPSFSELMSPERTGKILMQEILEKSGLSSEQFIDRYLVTDFMDMYENLSLKLGVNFEPHSQNLSLAVSADLKSIGAWVIRDFGGVWPDIVQMAKHGGPVSAYLDFGSAQKFKLKGGRSNAVSSVVFFYRRQVFDMLIPQLAKTDRTLTEAKIKALGKKFDQRFLKLLGDYYGYVNPEGRAPDMSNYKKVEEWISENTVFDRKLSDQEVPASATKEWIASKNQAGEWVGLNSQKIRRTFLSEHGLFAVDAKGNLVGFGLFNPREMPLARAGTLIPGVRALKAPSVADCPSAWRRLLGALRFPKRARATQ